MNLTWNLKDHGEKLEQEAAELVTTKIHFYEQIWSIFIGHKGNGQMADAQVASPEADRKRKSFAEHHYTILESIFLMYKIAKKEGEILKELDFEEYCMLMNNLIAFYAHCGRIRDNFLQCYTIMGYPKRAPDPTFNIKSFWEERHSVLHGKKIPLSIDENGLYLMPILKNSNNNVGWDEKATWDSVAKSDRVYISDSMMNVLNHLLPEINEMFSDLYVYVLLFIDENKIELNPPSKTVNIIEVQPVKTFDVSGTTYIDVYGFRNLNKK